MHTIVSSNKMNVKNVRDQPSLRILWKCSPSQHLKQMSMESDSGSDAEETEKHNKDISVKIAKNSKKTTSGLNNIGDLPLKSKTILLGKCFEHQRTTPSNVEIASVESKILASSKINSQVKDEGKTKSNDASSSLNNVGDVPSVPTIENRDNENGESPNLPKTSTDAAGDETNSKLHNSGKASTLNALEFFSGITRLTANKKHTIFTKMPHITQQSGVVSAGKDMSENSSNNNPSPACQNKVEIPVTTENKRPSSTGEVCTYISQEVEDNKSQPAAETHEPDLQELPCKAGTSDHQQTFERRASIITCRTGSSTALDIASRSCSSGLNPRMKRPDVPKTFIDRGVQVCRTEYGKSPTRLESKVNILESRIRLEELRSRHWITRVITAEKSLLKICEQLQVLDQAMKNLSSSHVLLQETKSTSESEKNNCPQVYENLIKDIRGELETLKLTSALQKNAASEENLPVNNSRS